jgi:hypothetical protein
VKAIPILIVLLLNLPVLSDAQIDYYSKENILRFADFLFAEGDYERAIGEYLRVASLEADQIPRDSLYYRIAAGFIYLSKPVQTRKYCSFISKKTSTSGLHSAVQCLTAFSYYIQGSHDSLRSFLKDFDFLPTEPQWQCRLAAIKIASLLKDYKWIEAINESEKAFNQPLGNCTTDSSIHDLLKIGQQGKMLRLKNPAIAGVLSAVIPGSGKVYANRAWDGLYSILIVGTMFWQAYEGFSKQGCRSTRGMTFGMLGVVFYAGNIYGSINAARIYNQSQNSAIAKRVHLDFLW